MNIFLGILMFFVSAIYAATFFDTIHPATRRLFSRGGDRVCLLFFSVLFLVQAVATAAWAVILLTRGVSQ